MKQLNALSEARAPSTTSSASADPTRRPATLQASPIPSRRARWTGPLAVILVLSILGFGGYAVDVPLSDLTASPITVGGDVRIPTGAAVIDLSKGRRKPPGNDGVLQRRPGGAAHRVPP